MTQQKHGVSAPADRAVAASRSSRPASPLRASIPNASHTPGPWEIAEDDRNGQAVVRAEHIEIATCWHHCDGSIEREMRFNALLIATAPSLLSTLDRYADTLCEGWCEKSSDCANFDDCGGCEARRIAGKARGELS